MTAVKTIQCQHSPLSVSGTRPSRLKMLFGIVCEARTCPWHCLRGAHVQPVGPGLLAVTCPLGTNHEASRTCPWHCLRSAHVQPVGPGLLAVTCPLGTNHEAISYMPLALSTRRPRSASGSRPSRKHMPSWH